MSTPDVPVARKSWVEGFPIVSYPHPLVSNPSEEIIHLNFLPNVNGIVNKDPLIFEDFLKILSNKEIYPLRGKPTE